MRRQLNQAIFAKIFVVDNDRVESELTDPARALIEAQVACRAAVLSTENKIANDAEASIAGNGKTPNTNHFVNGWIENYLVGLLQQHSKHVGVGAVHPELAYRAERSRRSTAKQDRPARRARQLRPDEVDTLEARFRELQHLTNVAREFGITRMTAARLLGERGIDTARRRMSSAEVRAASDSYLDGDSAATIGKRLGFAPHTVIKTLRAAGVEIRPRPGRA
ncbi:hypothetical protein J2D78_11570 [Microbacterium maritypicum]|uniref:hypothetical protein n=1 Tax=Microbacterium maritypicum TaxID=33918 RepID=UPI001B344992|nr:hypothetical protein [Microbacterium liquefaciens]MBP5802722.1 hypothetical protein [Microbacterium liquefaciens]